MAILGQKKKSHSYNNFWHNPAQSFAKQRSLDPQTLWLGICSEPHAVKKDTLSSWK